MSIPGFKRTGYSSGPSSLPPTGVRYNGIAVEQIGRYRVVGELGRGAMGVVYRAEDPAIGRTVAIKTIKLGELSDPSEREFMRERLLREARSAGILSHPGIVTIYDIAEEGDTAFVFMEFVNGDTLEKMVSVTGVLPKENILDVMRQTAAALDYAHGKGIVHRDIKPANIMISKDGQAKITDFGVAKILSQQMTQTRSVLGTPYYMSPEQIQGARIDGRSDQFALAVIAYELLTGERPYTADSLPTLLFKIVKEAPAPPQRINASLGPEVGKVFDKAFSKEAAGRYNSCTEFVSSLAMAVNKNPSWEPLPRGAASHASTMAATPPRAPRPRPPEPAPAGPQGQPALNEPPAEPEVAPGARTIAGTGTAVTGDRRRRRLEQESANDPTLIRAVVLVVLFVALLGGGYWAYDKYFSEGEVAVTEPPGERDSGVTVASTSPPAAGQPSGAEPAELTPGPAGGSASAEPGTTAPVEIPPPPKPEPPQTLPPQRPAPPKPAPAAPKDHVVRIRSNPAGARVTAGDDPLLSCVTPCDLTLREGRHVLTLTMAGHRLAPRIVQVPEITDVTVNLDRMAGTLAIRSTPPGATIALGGEVRSEKTPAMIKLPVGTYTIRLTLEGRPAFEDTVEVKDQVITSIGVDW